MPRLFLSAGDISGDQHAARLVERLRALVPGLEVEGLGGPELAAAGVPLHEDLVSRAIIGFGAALKEVPRLLGLLRRLDGILAARRPDLLVLVDYPGLNLHIARLAQRRGIPVVYFVAPQLWAWAPWRVRRFARVVDEALVLFPFEVPFFERAGLAATHVGLPLIDALPNAPPLRPEISERPLPVALLPGSRRREVAQHMPLFLAAARRLLDRHPRASFHGAHVDPIRRDEMAAAATRAGVPLQLHGDDVHGVMASCRAAVVSSGTATLETALLGTPQVVVYRLTPLERRLRDLILIPPFVGMVNLVAGRELAPELLLDEDDPAPLVDALQAQLLDGAARDAQLRGLAGLPARAGGPGAIERAARRLATRLGAAPPPDPTVAAGVAPDPAVDDGPGPGSAAGADPAPDGGLGR